MQRRSVSSERKAADTENLRLALAQLKHEAQEHGRRISAVELCKRAQVSRNCLYESHREIVRELGGLRLTQKSPLLTEIEAQMKRLKIRNAELELAVRQLASHCDAYYQAYSEVRRKLDRSEKTLASLRKEFANNAQVRRIR
jgi:hypothetical protein